MDPVLIMAVIVIMVIGSWIGVYCYVKKRKFYRDHASKLSGEVISWSSHQESNEIFTETYYDINVHAENGEIYQLSTNSSKALKYNNKRDIVIVVPDSFQNIEDYTYEDKPQQLIKIEEELDYPAVFRVYVIMGIILSLLTIAVTVVFVINDL